MKDYKDRFVSSKSKAMLAIVVSIIFLLGCIFGIMWCLYEFHYFCIIYLILWLAIMLPVLLFCIRMVYVVKVFQDRIEFKALLHKSEILYYTAIKNIVELNVTREGRYFLIEVEGRGDATS